jgi:phosphoglycerate dehydrogenase-like enzyme
MRLRSRGYLRSRVTSEDPMKLLIYHPRAEHYLNLIRKRFPGLDVAAGYERDVMAQHLPETDILIAWKFPLDLLKTARRLRWIQTTTVGIDHLMEAREDLRDVVVTNTRGIHADIVADYSFAAILLMQWNFSSLFRDQAEKKWGRRYTDPLVGKILAVIGVGAIGSEIARRARSFHMSVLGVKRIPGPVEGVDEIYGPDQLAWVLARSDFVVLALPATPDTYQIIGEKELHLMKRTAFLVNVSRGTVVDEASLLKALKEKWIAGATLDVFEKEPLPEESPLWSLENIIITPHLSGDLKDYPERVIEIFSKNLLRWQAGKPLNHVVDLARGY